MANKLVNFFHNDCFSLFVRNILLIQDEKILFQPPVGVVEPRTILSHLDNALDIAEFHKGQGAILQKVSVVTKPKSKLGE